VSSEEFPALALVSDVPADPTLRDVALLVVRANEALQLVNRRVRQIEGTLTGLVQAQQQLAQQQAGLARTVGRCPVDCPFRVEEELRAADQHDSDQRDLETKEGNPPDEPR
jgi:hypothetical protein